MITIVVDNTKVELPAEVAEKVAEHLWKGLERGAVIAAGRLAEALNDPPVVGTVRIEFPDYERDAVLDALHAVGDEN